MAVVKLPSVVVKVAGPLVAPEGTTAVNWPKLIPVGVAAGTPPNFTELCRSAMPNP